jgi:hypothetical protein
MAALDFAADLLGDSLSHPGRMAQILKMHSGCVVQTLDRGPGELLLSRDCVQVLLKSLESGQGLEQ